MQNVIDQFKSAMLEYGVTPPDEIIPDGQLHRFKINGKLDGAYGLHLDGRAAGWFQDFKQGIKEKWKLDGVFRKFTAEEKAEFKRQRQISEVTQKAELEAQYKAAAEKARYIYADAQPATSHAYLIRKNIKAHGAKIAPDGRLVIPLFNANIEIINVQFIAADGTKRFLKGGRKKGCFFAIGVKSEKLCIAEGFATAASIYEHTKQQTFVAFDAGNLEPVAQAIRRRNQDAEIIIMADNDLSGVGQTKAESAAIAVAGSVYICPVAGMDFNDYLSSNTEVAA